MLAYTEPGYNETGDPFDIDCYDSKVRPYRPGTRLITKSRGNTSLHPHKSLKSLNIFNYLEESVIWKHGRTT
jgi:hypothetical protein